VPAHEPANRSGYRECIRRIGDKHNRVILMTDSIRRWKAHIQFIIAIEIGGVQSLNLGVGQRIRGRRFRRIGSQRDALHQSK